MAERLLRLQPLEHRLERRTAVGPERDLGRKAIETAIRVVVLSPSKSACPERDLGRKAIETRMVFFPFFSS